MASRFRKVLIANRSEIACRIIRSARGRGYRTVAVFSEVDADALHVRLADEAVALGAAPAAQSYLSIEKIIAAAQATGADAIHPGYGFLSENPAFAEACADAGLIFIGPSPEAIRVMGDKAEAKRRMIAAGVPCVPGYQDDDQSDARLTQEAARIGFPVMVKAAAGGGGRGMRLVQGADALSAALRTARSEAKNAFGDDRLLLERALIDARHVEIQIFGDSHGNIIHLGERDCSVQRRHQKVVEEAPSPAVNADLRARMGAAAVQAAKAINYVGAGTIEFMLDRNGDFYFLEMNTRLQVEHPVTEMVTGLDLVALQFDVAEGKALPLAQGDVRLDGHAIEVRLYAEDPRQEFLPQTGAILLFEPAAREGTRVDHGLERSGIITPFYDPMLAKIIARGADREAARRLLITALEDTVLLGVTTNKEFLIDVLETDAFVQGGATTEFIARHMNIGPAAPPDFAITAVAATLFCDGTGQGWHSSHWLQHPVKLQIGETERNFRTARDGAFWNVAEGGESAQLRILERTADCLRYEMNGQVRSLRFARVDDTLHLDLGRRVLKIEDRTFAPPAPLDATADGILRAPMNGSVIAIRVVKGARVTRGEIVAVLEAMKMQHEIVAPADGTVEQVAVQPGAQVATRDPLVIVKMEDAA
ncbi:MAG: geranyl-CoA carboxylase alpha subunit [Methylobacteriaceae bacterium]|jgi:geranyl-CoA carboxylase alpha subunit|nr:geranyl-CoA carboxylase alpha subunit [Methylobacteriaceae bacterium]